MSLHHSIKTYGDKMKLHNSPPHGGVLWFQTLLVLSERKCLLKTRAGLGVGAKGKAAYFRSTWGVTCSRVIQSLNLIVIEEIGCKNIPLITKHEISSTQNN